MTFIALCNNNDILENKIFKEEPEGQCGNIVQKRYLNKIMAVAGSIQGGLIYKKYEVVPLANASRIGPDQVGKYGFLMEVKITMFFTLQRLLL